jgi:hypothetical protein
LKEKKILKNDTLINDQNDILKEAKSYYNNLYQSNLSEYWKEHATPFTDMEVKLTEEKQNSCEGPLSLDECLQSLKRMNDRKSPLVLMDSRWNSINSSG